MYPPNGWILSDLFFKVGLVPINTARWLAQSFVILMYSDHEQQGYVTNFLVYVYSYENCTEFVPVRNCSNFLNEVSSKSDIK